MGSTAPRASVLLANLAALATASTVHGQTKVVYVDDDAPAGGDGTSWGSAFRYLDDALAVANASRATEFNIHIAQGTYTPGRGSLDKTSSFMIEFQPVSSSSVSLFGGFAGIGTVNPSLRDTASFITVLSADLGRNDPNISSDNAYRILDAEVAMGTTLDGLYFRGTRALGESWTYALSLMLYSPQDFLMVNGPVDSVIRDCTFEDHQVGSSQNLVTIFNSQRGSRILIEDCTFKNVRSFTAHSMIVVGGRSEITRSRFLTDEQWGRAPIVWTPGQALLKDCDFLGMRVAFQQSDFSPASAPTVIDRCLFVSPNDAQEIATIATSNARIRDSIIQSTSAVTMPLLKILPGGGFVSVENCNVDGGQGAVVGATSKLKWLEGNITSDPEFTDIDGTDNDLFTWDDNDLRLSPTSPCIDAGRPVAPIAGMLDLIGSPRFFDGNGDFVARLDMGPREYPSRCDADFDGSGFVDTDDFDAFVRAFEAGC
jgi:hypothetical protein